MYNISKDNHYFLQMSKLNNVYFMGEKFISYKSSSDQKRWVECEIVEDTYKVSDRYKVELKALDEQYGSETFYQSDFCSLMKDGYIIEKTSENQHVEKIRWYEPLAYNTPLVCEAYVLVE